MLALFAVLGPVHPRTIKPFLPSFLSWRHSREKRYQALSHFSILIATESWAGPGNEASFWSLAVCKNRGGKPCPFHHMDDVSVYLGRRKIVSAHNPLFVCMWYWMLQLCTGCWCHAVLVDLFSKWGSQYWSVSHLHHLQLHSFCQLACVKKFPRGKMFANWMKIYPSSCIHAQNLAQKQHV